MNISMEYQQLIEAMSPEIYQRLVRAVELGKWPDGKILTTGQRANAMQAIIAWGERHLAQTDRVGYVQTKQKAEPCATLQETPLSWRDQDGR